MYNALRNTLRALSQPARATANPLERQQFWMLHGLLPLLLTVLLYAWSEHTDLDLQVSHLIYAANGNHFFDNWFMERVMHDGARALGHILAYVLLLALLLSVPWKPLRPARMTLIFMIISVAVGTSLVVKLKHLTNVHCPYNLMIFGDDQPLNSPFDVTTWNPLKSGECWPGGHSSYGFAMWMFYFAAREHRRPWALPILIAIAIYGNILGAGRVIQGAHFLSHQWWTASICWFSTLFFYVLLLRRDLLPAWRVATSEKMLLQESAP